VPGTPYTGRFAPSPTGDLHFGSLVAAIGCYLQARAAGGRWLVRIEDLDPPRVVPGSADRIVADLERFGMVADEPVLHQSTRNDAYEAALEQLERKGLLFPCACTRSELPPGPYPGTCRDGLPRGREGRSLRVRVPDRTVRFVDRVQGLREENLTQTSGDFVLRRADGYYAYQLAVVVDDAWQGVTEVVRGADLIGSTARQLYLQEALELPQPDYLHLPVVNDESGRKLGKRYRSDPVARLDPQGVLGAALDFLGHPPPTHDTLTQRWAWAIQNWDPDRIPKRSQTLTGVDGQALYFEDAGDDDS
jgi:glutamyl-Q tRNA(Asp) synthetase